jgi:hypothetical protein
MEMQHSGDRREIPTKFFLEIWREETNWRRSEDNIKIEIKEMGCELCWFAETHSHSAD